MLDTDGSLISERTGTRDDNTRFAQRLSLLERNDDDLSPVSLGLACTRRRHRVGGREEARVDVEWLECGRAVIHSRAPACC